MFTNLYLQTTNPKLTFSELISPNILPYILFSAIFHAILYSVFLNLVNYIFFGNPLSSLINTRLVGSLVVIMSFGFLARFFHVKDIFRAYHNNMEKTRNHLDKLYITWIFIS